MNKSSVNPKVVVFGLTLLIAVVVGWFMVISPKRSEASRLDAQIEDTRVQIAAAQGATDGGTTPPVNPIRVTDLFELSRAMPDRADIPNVLLQLSAISAETGVSFKSITPQDPAQVGDYQQIRIDLTFQGHFYDLSDFLFRLRNLVGVHQGELTATGRLFSVDSVAFNEGELLFPQVKATLSVSAYVFGDGLADPLPPGATGSGTVEAAPATTAPATDSQPIPAAPTAAGA